MKAENILLNLDGNIRIADLGLISMVQAQNTKHHYRMVGTPYYMAPEVRLLNLMSLDPAHA